MMSNAVYPRVLRAPTTSFFLLGARGVGKSTWARLRCARARRIDLLDEGLFQQLPTEPELFAGMLRTVREDGWVVVDGVQRIPGLLNEVHRFIEERRPRFALLGSSARKLKTAGTNLLALEVKAARTFSRSQLGGLKAIAGLPNVVRRILVYGGSHQLEVADGIEVWPVEHLVEALAQDRLWP